MGHPLCQSWWHWQIAPLMAPPYLLPAHCSFGPPLWFTVPFVIITLNYSVGVVYYHHYIHSLSLERYEAERPLDSGAIYSWGKILEASKEMGFCDKVDPVRRGLITSAVGIQLGGLILQVPNKSNNTLVGGYLSFFVILSVLKRNMPFS